jgi:hypothetical protein
MKTRPAVRLAWISLAIPLLIAGQMASGFTQNDLAAKCVNDYEHRKGVINLRRLQAFGFGVPQPIIAKVIFAAQHARLTANFVNTSEWNNRDLDMFVKQKGITILLMDRYGHVAYNHKERTLSRAELKNMRALLNTITLR